MDLLNKRNIPAPAGDDTVFRLALWGPVITFFLFLAGLAFGVAVLAYCYQHAVVWGMVLSGLYVLLMAWICQVLWRALLAALSSANWLARIGSRGILLKYRSYLHDDSPDEDPIAVQLSWAEIAAAQLQEEIHTTMDIDEKRQVRRWFLDIQLDLPADRIARIRDAIAFEHQRKPAHFAVDELKHELFEARKRRAGAAEISRIKRQIATEKQRHPGRKHKTSFRDRAVVFIAPDRLRMEWTHLTPNRRRLRRLLERHTAIRDDEVSHIDTTRKLTEKEFQASLATLLKRNESIEAVKLVRTHLNVGATEARTYIQRLQP